MIDFMREPKQIIDLWKLEARKQKIIQEAIQHNLDVEKYAKWLGIKFVQPFKID